MAPAGTPETTEPTSRVMNRPTPIRLLFAAAPCALAAIASPQTGLSEVGDDFDISVEGAIYSIDPHSVYDPTRDRFLVVWSEGPDEPQVQGRLVDAETGVDAGTGLMTFSDAGSASVYGYARSPQAAYNSAADEFLVVWAAYDLTAPGVSELEIFGQRIDAETGLELGTNDFRISDMGALPSDSGYAFTPDVVYNPTADEYLVVWAGGDNEVGDFALGAREIFAQRLTGATATEVGVNDFPISSMGASDSDEDFDAESPCIAFNRLLNQYVVAWSGDDDTPPLSNGVRGIFMQRLDASGTELGADDILVSSAGAGRFPAIVHDPSFNQFLIVWSSGAGLTGGDHEIFGRLVFSEGPTSSPQFQISSMDGNGEHASDPSVAFDELRSEFLVVWTGERAPGEWEIHGQWLEHGSGGEVGEDDFRVSSVGPDGNGEFYAWRPHVSLDSRRGRFLATFEATLGEFSGMVGIHGQFLRSTKALESLRTGTPSNPAVFQFGATSGPVLGQTWDPRVNHGGWFPEALLDVMLIGFAPLEPGFDLGAQGTLLVDVTIAPLWATTTPGQAFTLPIPNAPELVGVELSTQAWSSDGTTSYFTNAVDIAVGTY